MTRNAAICIALASVLIFSLSAPAQVIERISVNSMGKEANADCAVAGSKRVVSADGRCLLDQLSERFA